MVGILIVLIIITTPFALSALYTSGASAYTIVAFAFLALWIVLLVLRVRENHRVARAKQQLRMNMYNTMTHNMAGPINMNHNVTNDMNKVALLKQYKELLDTGVITQQEFERKKRELR